MSKLSDIIYDQLINIFGIDLRIQSEFYLGEGLRLDFYLVDYGIGIEVDGQQHFSYNSYFYKDKLAFEEAKLRDRRKEELCCSFGISLIRISFDQIPNEEELKILISEAMSSKHDNSWVRYKRSCYRYQYKLTRKELGKKIRQEAYRRAKEWKKYNGF